MTRKEYLEKYCKEVQSEIDLNSIDFVTKDTEVYIGLKGLTDNAKRKHDIVDLLIKHKIFYVDSSCKKDRKYPVANIGYSKEENKWYGWSHRGIFGFTIGSEVKKGHVAYNASNKEDYEKDVIHFWNDSEYKTVSISKREKEGFWLKFAYNDKVPNKNMRNKIDERYVKYPQEYGRGEWIAKTIEDAKQMAIDYANNIS